MIVWSNKNNLTLIKNFLLLLYLGNLFILGLKTIKNDYINLIESHFVEGISVMCVRTIFQLLYWASAKYFYTFTNSFVNETI